MRETDSERKKGKGVGKGQKEILVHSEWKEGKQMRRCVPLHVQKKKSYREESISREVRLLRQLWTGCRFALLVRKKTASSLDPLTKDNVRDREQAYLLVFAF